MERVISLVTPSLIRRIINRRLRYRFAVALLLVLPAASSCRGVGVTGKAGAGQWLRGKALSLNLVVGTTKYSFNPLFTLRNDSDREIPIPSIKMVVGFKQAGRKELEHSFSDLTGKPKLLEPHEELSFGLTNAGIWQFEMPEGDRPEEIRVLVGQPESDQHEAFTVIP